MRLIDADALKQDLTRFYDNVMTARQFIDEQPTAGGWISAKDRLPDENLMVLGYTPCDGYMFVGFRKTSIFGNNEWYIITAMRSTRTMKKKVTYWMPLPEPPMEGDQNA